VFDTTALHYPINKETKEIAVKGSVCLYKEFPPKILMLTSFIIINLKCKYNRVFSQFFTKSWWGSK
jgi:hypothetical protein